MLQVIDLESKMLGDVADGVLNEPREEMDWRDDSHHYQSDGVVLPLGSFQRRFPLAKVEVLLFAD